MTLAPMRWWCVVQMVPMWHSNMHWNSRSHMGTPVPLMWMHVHMFHTFPMSHMGSSFRVGRPWPLKKTHVSFYFDVGKPTSFHFCRFTQCRFFFEWHRFWNFHFKKKHRRKIVIFSLHAKFCQKLPLKMRIKKIKLYG